MLPARLQLDATEATISALRREVLALKSENSYLRDCTLAGAVAAGVQLPPGSPAPGPPGDVVQGGLAPEASPAAPALEQPPPPAAGTEGQAGQGALQGAAASAGAPRSMHLHEWDHAIAAQCALQTGQAGLVTVPACNFDAFVQTQ